MTINVLTKALGGIQDLLFGQGSQAQTRDGNSLNINRIEIIKPLADLTALQALDVTDEDNFYPYAKTMGGTILGDYYATEWWFDVTEPIANDDGITIIAGNGATIGCWKVINSGLKFKSIPLGTWDMTASKSAVIPHNLDNDRIQFISATIRHDNAINKYNLLSDIKVLDTVQQHIFSDATNITVRISTSGHFDTANYSNVSGGYNRGWIIIGYI